MVGVALGMATEGHIPFVSTFACFLTRAYDFIRMAAYSKPPHLILCGSHAGVSIGEDGPSQMALEDLAMMRALTGATVLYPSDAVSAERLVETAARPRASSYMRTLSAEDPRALRQRRGVPDRRLQGRALVGARRGHGRRRGRHAARGARGPELLAKEGIAVRVIDLYSIKPVDAVTLQKAAARDPGHRHGRGPQRLRRAGRSRGRSRRRPHPRRDPGDPQDPPFRQADGADAEVRHRRRLDRRSREADGLSGSQEPLGRGLHDQACHGRQLVRTRTDDLTRVHQRGRAPAERRDRRRGGRRFPLVDRLIERGFTDLTVVDVSAVALERSREGVPLRRW